jgi:cytochrome c biogenesis protein
MTQAPSRPPRGEPPGAAPASRLPVIPGPGETAAVAWRRLRRMSTALYLLLALAAITVVGTFIPQEPVIPQTVASWRQGTAGPGQDVAAVFDQLGLFDIFGSWWFTALVVLLAISLIGCLVPRTRGFWRTVRQPPAPGRNLRRLTHHAEVASSLPPAQAVEAADAVLARHRLRRRRLAPSQAPTGHHQLAAERGHAREGGSLLFHVSFFVVLAGALVGAMFGMEAHVNVVEGEAFADTPVGYGSYEPGRFWSLDDHPGFTVRLDEFAATYHDDTDPDDGVRSSLIADDFSSQLTILEGGEPVSSGTVRVNEPLSHAGLSIYQIRFGYAPKVRVTTGDGDVLTADTTNLVEQGQSMVWTGVLPVERSSQQNQIALELALLPDAAMNDQGMPVSRSNEPVNPRLAATLWYGELGLQRNRPARQFDRQSGNRLPQPVILSPGERGTFEPLGLQVAFPELPYWSGFQVSHEPGRGLLLAGAGMLLAGLIPSLYAYRRRVWVDAAPDGDGSRVVVAGVARHRSDRFAERWPELAGELSEAVGGRRPRDPAPPGDDAGGDAPCEPRSGAP